jgi:uncharacterized delta-60 repeat protein
MAQLSSSTLRTRRSGRRRRRLAGAATGTLMAVLLAACGPTPASGDLDTGFSSDGIQTGVSGSQLANASALQTDGKLVVAGVGAFDDGTVSQVGTYVMRYASDGAIDATYAAKFSAQPGFESVRDMALDGSNNAYVVGYGNTTDPADTADIYVAKLNANGGLVSSFGGGDGIQTIDLSNHDRVGGVAVSGNRVYVAASQDDSGNFSRRWTVLALNATSGALDTSFSGDGIADIPTTKLNTADSLRDIALQSDGKILLGGFSGTQFAIARMTTAGALDATFDGDGVATTTVGNGGQAYKLLLQPDGKSLLVGYAGETGHTDYDFAAVRYTTAGALDTSFSADGKAFVDFGSLLNDKAFSGVLAADGKIVLGGFANGASAQDFATARLNWDGTLDTSFSNDGLVKTSTLATSNEQIESMTLAANDRVIGVGENLAGWSLVAYAGSGNTKLSVNDVTVTEGNSGTTNASLTVKLSVAWSTPVTVRWNTTAGTANAGSDFTATSGTVTFAPGETSKTISVPVIGNTVKESTKTFSVNLSLPTNAAISDNTGVVTINDND